MNNITTIGLTTVYGILTTSPLPYSYGDQNPDLKSDYSPKYEYVQPFNLTSYDNNQNNNCINIASVTNSLTSQEKILLNFFHEITSNLTCFDEDIAEYINKNFWDLV